MMDTSGFSQVGRYGTISLLKRNEDHTVVTSFGIDTEELTFGRETTCGVRLYYPDVALLHCKVVFEERKAFLVVLGESGVFVDGCKVFPRTSNNLSTIIPLANNSEFEIHSKRFRYSYPPKEIRAVLFATPARPRNRGLRLSMIHSAQVFSPYPSKDPRENLKILQSPLKNSFKSPVKTTPQEEDEIVLVQGSHPRVVQEDRDLVILEDVALEPPSPTKPHTSSLELPRTPPRRKSLGGNALHRAVLIRSAQRAVIKAEKEREEEEEEMEVFGAVVGADDQDEYEREDIEMGSPTDKEDYLGKTEQSERDDQKPLWRKSLGKIMWPFGGSQENAQDSNETDDGSTSEDDEDNQVPTTPPSMNLYSTGADFTHQEDEDKDDTEIPTPLPSRSNVQYTPIRRTFGSFMTPQAKSRPLAHDGDRAADVRPAIGRFSLGGGEAKRVVMQQPWRVRDIVIPPIDAAPSNSTRSPEKATKASTIIPQTPNHLHDVTASTHTPMRTPARPTLTEGERKAIQERRRSALKETGSFFFGVAPGLTPAKSKSSSSSSSPVKESSGLYNSSMKGHIIHEEDDEIKDEGIVQEDKEEKEDVRCLLDRMKETVDEMRRRRSVVLRVAPHTEGLSPHPLLAPVATPQRPLFQPELHQMVDSMGDEGNEVKEQEPFSLLRPGAREEVVPRLVPATREVESSIEGPIPLPIVVLDPIDEVGGSESRDNPEIPEQPIRAKGGRSRLLRTPKPINVVPGSSEPNVEEEQKEAGSKPRSRSTGPATRRSRSRTPQPPVPEQQEESDKVVQTIKSTIGDSDVTASRRTRKATAELEEPQPPLPATGKRGRKAPVDATFEQPEHDKEKPKEMMPVKRSQKADKSVEGEEQHLDQGAEGSLKVTTTPAAAKRGRPRKVVQESLDEDTIPPVPVITKAGTRKKTTTPGRSKSSRIQGTRKAVTANTAVQNDDDDEDEDPLDSYNAVEIDVDEVDPPGPPPPSGINETKTKGRKKVTATVAVKQEVDDEQSFSDLEEDALLATAKGITTRASGARKGGRATPTTRTPAATDGGRKTRTRTPATAPASTTCTGSDKDKDKDKDKENAVSGDREDSEMQAHGVTVKVRVSRSRGATAGGEETTGKTRTGSGTTTRSASKAVKVEVFEEAAVVVEPVRVRRTRAKTKTG